MSLQNIFFPLNKRQFFFLRLSGKFLQYFFQFCFLHKRQTESLMPPKISKIQGRWQILFLCISKTFCCFFRQNFSKKSIPLLFLKVSGQICTENCNKNCKILIRNLKKLKIFEFFLNFFIIFAIFFFFSQKIKIFVGMKKKHFLIPKWNKKIWQKIIFHVLFSQGCRVFCLF